MAGMVVQHNINALNAYNRLNFNVAQMKKASEKLSSGYRINRAGDDAAGLAISEKMRAQIRGLGQAKRNAQDGISMVQTFEGALQETHSILQRMKELAVESANESYDNATDRAAIQLEFDQLNDELNQIADTDFNGVVALNGGEMADGLKVDENGEFNYKAQAEKLAAEAAAEADLIDSAQHYNGDTVGTEILDNSKYGMEDGKTIWDTLEITDESTVAAATGAVTPDKININFAYDGSKWVAVSATRDGTEIEGANLSALTTTAVGPTDDATGAGGFTIDGTSLNVIFDTSDVQKYDTASVEVTFADIPNMAPTNVGVSEDTWTPVATATAGDISVLKAPTVEIGALTDDDMTTAVKTALDALVATELTMTVANGTVTWGGTMPTNPTGVAGSTLTLDTTAGTITLKMDAADTTGIVLATLKADTMTGLTTGANKFKLDFDAYSAAGNVALTAESSAWTGPEMSAEVLAEAVGEDTRVSIADAFGQSTAILTYTKDMTLQVGARTKDAVQFTFKYDADGMGDLEANMNVSARDGGLETDSLSLATQEDANAAIDKIDNAINKVSMVRATFGAIQNRLEHKIENITATSENLTEAESTIRDTDMAAEMMNYTKYNILQQAAQSMLAQANQQPQSILQLLG